ACGPRRRSIRPTLVMRAVRIVLSACLGLLAASVVLLCAASAAAAGVLARLADRIGGQRGSPPVTFATVLRWCAWCERRTVHQSRPGRRRPACLHTAHHGCREAYQRLAACYPDAAAFRGCICAPGETTRFSGAPD